MNIVDKSGIRTVADAKARHLPASAGWRDLHVRMVGAQVANVSAAMDRLWRRVLNREKLAWPPWPIAKMLSSPPETIDFFDFRPTQRYRRAHRVFVPLIRSARSEIVLAMAYFVPVGRVLRELLRARRRGVTVRVIVPQESDVRIVRWASRHFYAYLLRRGIRIYERRDQMLHSKVMVVDGRWSVIGSCNLDPRSLRINLEFIGVLQSPALAEIVRQVCLYEIEHSDRVLLAHWRGRTFWQRLGDRIAWSLRRFL
jgi:cardiolipin synthase